MTLTIASGIVQQAAYELLEAASITWQGDADSPAAVPVLDYVPENQAFPYVMLHNIIEAPTDNLTTRGRTMLMTIDVLSRYSGWTETDGIAAQVVAALDRQQAAMDAPGLSVWRCAFRQVVHIVAADGYTRQGAIEFQVDVQDAD